jgi:triosephosphate isomerase
MIDFRPFPVGTSLLPDSDGDSDDNYRFVYERDGQRQEFDINNLPDSTWTFVDRTELPGRNAGGEHLAIFEGDSDVSDEVISSEGKEILLVIPEPIRADISYSYTINEISEYADSLGVSMRGLLSADEQGIERWRDVSMAEYPCYTVDDTQLKELARGTMAIVMLNDGVITSKTTINSINLPEVESPSSPERFFDELSGNVNFHFKWLNIVFGVGLLLLYLCQGIIIAIRLQFKQKRASKRAKNATEPQPDAPQTAE